MSISTIRFRRKSTLSGLASDPGKDEDQLIFGYGSLMWDPGFEPSWQAPAKVLGWHRKFSLVSTQAWGTEAAPGLCAVLHPGGSCWGRVLCIPAADRALTEAQLGLREAAYLKHYATIDVLHGEDVVRRKALTYVVNPLHERLDESLDPHQKKRLIHQGRGEKGSSLNYLSNTVACLTQDGHTHTDAHKLLALVHS